MKKILVIILATFFLMGTGFSQKKDIPYNISYKMNGGIWIGFNSSTTFIGLPGPKISTILDISDSEETNLEIGIHGIPGLILGKDLKAGLCLGITHTLHTKMKVKPIFGVMFLRTSEWQTLYGLGVLF